MGTTYLLCFAFCPVARFGSPAFNAHRRQNGTDLAGRDVTTRLFLTELQIDDAQNRRRCTVRHRVGGDCYRSSGDRMASGECLCHVGGERCGALDSPLAAAGPFSRHRQATSRRSLVVNVGGTIGLQHEREPAASADSHRTSIYGSGGGMRTAPPPVSSIRHPGPRRSAATRGIAPLGTATRGTAVGPPYWLPGST